jgi:endonuclease/exonuclease/phosphatase family metal-dependent hydrolase
MHRATSAIGLAGALLVCGAPSLAAAPLDRPLKVMTYNIGSAAGIPLGLEQIDQIAREIKRERADIVGMTEVDIGTDWHGDRDMVGELAVALARNGYVMHHYYTPTLTYHGGNMVLVIWSRFIIEAGDFVVTKEEGPAGWKAARIEVKPDGRNPLHVFMTHYWIGDGSKHKQQTDHVIAFVNRFEGARIVMGDFNFTPAQPYYRQYIDAGFQDACIATVGRHLPTVGGGAGKVAPPQRQQIDFIFGSPEVRFRAAYVPETTVSDHWPLVAAFTTGPSPVKKER